MGFLGDAEIFGINTVKKYFDVVAAGDFSDKLLVVGGEHNDSVGGFPVAGFPVFELENIEGDKGGDNFF